jgi:DNA-binding GntR family transcriptional regulator
MQEYEAARETVRKAVDQLRREGLVSSSPGRGVFVRKNEPLQTVVTHEGDQIIGRMPDPQERARLDLDDGVGVLIICRRDGTVEVHAQDRIRVVVAGGAVTVSPS